MSTVIRPKVSKSKEYYISKHKYYELKHFCLQYPEWREEYRRLNLLKGNRIDRVVVDEEGRDITSEVALKKHDLFMKMEMVEQAAIATDPDLKDYILAAVTDGVNYEYLRLSRGIPCGRQAFYNRYHLFFYLLSQQRQF